MPPVFWVGVAALGSLLTVVAMVFTRRRRVRARELYQHHLEDALADGVLTEEEAEELAEMRQDHDIGDAEVRMVALSIYRRALNNAIADSRITPEEDATLKRLQKLLELEDRDLREDRQQMQRVHLLARIERGDLPRVNAPVALDAGEVCHWVVQARMAQKLTIPGPPRPPLEALRFRIEATTAFHIDGLRDSLKPSEEILPLDLGMLLVTSRRTLFRGARRSAALPHVKLEGVDLFKDGVRLDPAPGEPAQLFLLDDSELTAAILLAAARARRNEVRGAATA